MLRTIVSAIACLALLGGQAIGQPANPLPPGNITILVPLAAGGPADALARTLANGLGPRLGRTVVVENKPGAAGNIGAATVAAAPANGLTWLFTVDSVVTVNPHLAKTAGFDATKDLVPAARVGGVSLILAVNAKSVPAKTFAELLDYSKTHTLNFGSAGIGSPGHLAFEYLRMQSGIKGTHVPYKGAALVMNDLLAGQIEAAFVAGGALIAQVKAGTLRALAVSSETRNPQLPEVPTAIEAGVKGFDAVFSNYLLAPAATPPAALDFMAAQVKEVMAQPEVSERIKSLFMEPGFAGPTESQARIAQDREKWGKVVAATGMKQN
jgi:tripartite-type tricarboxylate transporter receptor subunit TctC